MSSDRLHRLGLGLIAEKALAGERLSTTDGERLFACPEPLAVGALAHAVRRGRHGSAVYFVVNRHLNYSNVCVNRCRFCAFRRDEGEEGAFTHDLEALLAKLTAMPEARLSEIHVVGGCHPSLPLSFFEELLRRVREVRPKAVLKCFTAAEIAHLARLEGISAAEVLSRLKAAGLDMLAGGGAEIFAPEVRGRICPEKVTGEDWLAIHAAAHGLGLRSNCTMLYGHVESVADRLEHLEALRGQQDRTGGFTCFIPLPYQAKANRLGLAHGPSGLDTLKTIAVSRLMLDNIVHLKAYWVMLGVKLAQVALHFGADDLDGTVVEEHIGRMAGAASDTTFSRAELTSMIIGCGLTPVERDGAFRPLSGEAP